MTKNNHIHIQYQNVTGNCKYSDSIIRKHLPKQDISWRSMKQSFWRREALESRFSKTKSTRPVQRKTCLNKFSVQHTTERNPSHNHFDHSNDQIINLQTKQSYYEGDQITTSSNFMWKYLFKNIDFLVFVTFVDKRYLRF